MAAEWEINPYRKDAAAARIVSRAILSASPEALNEWEEGFLESLEARTWQDELSTPSRSPP